MRVAIFSTGDEIVEPGAPLPAAGLYDANRELLRGLLSRLDAEVSDLGILRDDREKLVARLAEAAQGQDLVLTSGGVSTGEADYVKDAIGAAGSLVFWRVAIKPGRPVAMGVLRGTAFVGLPGNPVAVFVTFARVVRPLLLRLAGATPEPLIALPVKAGFPYRKKKGRREYVRVSLTRLADGSYEAHKHPQDGAGVISSLTATDGLAELDDDVTEIAQGRDDRLPAVFGAGRLNALLCGERGRFRSASSGVFTLKNGSTGSVGQSASATPWRAVHTSILRRSSTVTAWRRSSRSATCHSPPPDGASRRNARRRAACPRASRAS